MPEWLRHRVTAWTVSAAFTLTLAQLVAPSFLDWIFDFLVVGLVYVAAKLSKAKG